MTASVARGVLVTGTDTGVGKTLASAALLHAWRARGLRVAGMKPVASGSILTAEGLRNDDAFALQAASSVPVPHYDDVNPYALPVPTAPQLAARAAGVVVTLPRIVAAHARLAGNADMVVVEGAGGWLAPLADGIEHADLARALTLPVVLVVGLRLGCLNHARLSARAIAADGCVLAGWIGSVIEPGFDDAYLGLLREALPASCLGVMAHADAPEAQAIAAALDVTRLAGETG